MISHSCHTSCNTAHTTSPERKGSIRISRTSCAAIMMIYDVWIYGFGMMTTNIPSTIYISLDTLSPTASTAYIVRKIHPKSHIADGGGQRRRFMTALRRTTHHILLHSTFIPSTFLQTGIITCESLRGFLIPCCGGLTQHLLVKKKESERAEATLYR